MEYHNPVLLKECIDGLNINPEGIYVDVTFGGGGHSREILKHLTTGKLYAFDQDDDAVKNKIDDPRFVLIKQNFRKIIYCMKNAKIRHCAAATRDGRNFFFCSKHVFYRKKQ